MQVPRTRYLAPEPGDSELSVLFYGMMKQNGVRCYEIEQKLGAAPATVRKWLRHPEEAPLGKLILLCKMLGISRSKFLLTVERMKI